MVSVYDFTCVDQQLHKLTVGHQELGDQVDVPVSKKWWNDWWNEVLWHCFLPSPSIALIRRRNPKLGEKFLQGCQRGRFTSIVFVPEVESEGRRTEMELEGSDKHIPVHVEDFLPRHREHSWMIWFTRNNNQSVLLIRSIHPGKGSPQEDNMNLRGCTQWGQFPGQCSHTPHPWFGCCWALKSKIHFN